MENSKLNRINELAKLGGGAARNRCWRTPISSHPTGKNKSFGRETERDALQTEHKRGEF